MFSFGKTEKLKKENSLLKDQNFLLRAELKERALALDAAKRLLSELSDAASDTEKTLKNSYIPKTIEKILDLSSEKKLFNNLSSKFLDYVKGKK